MSMVLELEKHHLFPCASWGTKLWDLRPFPTFACLIVRVLFLIGLCLINILVP